MNRIELNNILATDLKRFDGRKPSVLSHILHNESYYVWKYIKHMRYVEYYFTKRGLCRLAYYWHWLILKRLQFKLHIYIYPFTVGPGFRLYHIGDYTHIGPNVTIGKNCTIVSGVVFGNKTEIETKGQVFVGDNVYFGLGCKVLGPVRIGNNVIIGANAVVTKDLPDNSVACGVPARVIRYNLKLAELDV